MAHEPKMYKAAIRLGLARDAKAAQALLVSASLGFVGAAALLLSLCVWSDALSAPRPHVPPDIMNDLRIYAQNDHAENGK